MKLEVTPAYVIWLFTNSALFLMRTDLKPLYPGRTRVFHIQTTRNREHRRTHCEHYISCVKENNYYTSPAVDGSSCYYIMKLFQVPTQWNSVKRNLNRTPFPCISCDRSSPSSGNNHRWQFQSFFFFVAETQTSTFLFRAVFSSPIIAPFFFFPFPYSNAPKIRIRILDSEALYIRVCIKIEVLTTIMVQGGRV